METSALWEEGLRYKAEKLDMFATIPGEHRGSHGSLGLAGIVNIRRHCNMSVLEYSAGLKMDLVLNMVNVNTSQRPSCTLP